MLNLGVLLDDSVLVPGVRGCPLSDTAECFCPSLPGADGRCSDGSIHVLFCLTTQYQRQVR